MSALVACNASKRFGGLVALNDVSLDLRPGEVHGLIGPNGSGKTTLLNLLSGYYEPTNSANRLGGEALYRTRVQHRARLGIARTFQKPGLLGTMTVLDNAMLGAWRDVRSNFVSTALALGRTRREEREFAWRAGELLMGVGLGHAVHRRADLLEHAEQRFLEIARALAMRPRFI